MINKIKILYDIYFSRINVDRQLQRGDAVPPVLAHFSRINVDRQLQLFSHCGFLFVYFSRINVDRQLQQIDGLFEAASTLAGSMWTGNYNGSRPQPGACFTLAGSMWTGNYN